MVEEIIFNRKYLILGIGIIIIIDWQVELHISYPVEVANSKYLNERDRVINGIRRNSEYNPLNSILF